VLAHRLVHDVATGGLAAVAATLVITAINKPLRRYTIPDQAIPHLELSWPLAPPETDPVPPAER